MKSIRGVWSYCSQRAFCGQWMRAEMPPPLTFESRVTSRRARSRLYLSYESKHMQMVMSRDRGVTSPSTHEQP